MSNPTVTETRISASSIQTTALALFNAAAAVYDLPEKLRPLLETAAAYYTAALETDLDRPDRTGRDLALAAPHPDLSADDQVIVASVIALQRAKIRPKQEPSFIHLSNKGQEAALRLAAILRVATAPEAGPDDLLIRVVDDDLTLIVGGKSAPKRVASVEERADLWRETLGALVIRPAKKGEIALLRADDDSNEHGANGNGKSALELPTIAETQKIGDEPIAEAARRTLRRFFDKLLARERAVIGGEDPEDVHQMRVATRRLRASLQVAEGVYDDKAIRRHRRGLQRIATSLGTVRDCDVFLEHVTGYRDALPAEQRAEIAPLIDALEQERKGARKKLLNDLEAKRYRKFKHEFAAFLTTPGAAALPPPEPGITQRVRDFAGSAIWRRYELWRAYEVALPEAADETLHEARIAGKRLRYTLEFFADALGSGSTQVLDPLVDLQDALGGLQDGVVAREHVARLGLADDPGAQTYLAQRDGERAKHLAALFQRWDKIDSATYRRKLFELILKI